MGVARYNTVCCLFVFQGITLASAKAVAAGNSLKQVDVSACANLGNKAVGELLKTCMGTSLLAEGDDDRDRSVLTDIAHCWFLGCLGVSELCILCLLFVTMFTVCYLCLLFTTLFTILPGFVVLL